MLKVEALEAFPISIKAEEDLKGGTFRYSHFQTVLVRAVCDGVEGWGEAMTRFDPEATALMVRYLGKALAGREYPDVETAWNQVWKELRVRGHTRGISVEALSGIEIALYDCLGKASQKPLNTFFSANPTSEVGVFAGSLFASRGSLVSQVELVRAKELGGAKIKIGFGVDEDVRTLSAVRRAWPEGLLVADANGAYDAKNALKAAAAFSDFNLAWFEEPVLSDDWAGYTALKGSKVRIGAGESWFADDFDRPIEEKLVGVLDPSVSRCGGVAVEMDVAEKGSARGLAFSPMTGMNSAISLAASLHAASARPSIGVEFNPFTNPLQSDLAVGLEAPRAGKIRVPHGHGLGISVDTAFVRKHSR
ncbi:MAG TPA: enolase C-terminal domain-like protein [Nitrososphaerales archaeon]|nr:enolase C-terminal domain-like protein [Nitrososphaerales archaeon]